MNGTFISISKIDAARRQLDAALALYFDQGDPAAIYTLTAAAHGILRDLSAAAGSAMLVEGSLERSIGKELTLEAVKAMRIAQNFFKHADKDPDGSYKFSPRSTDLLLLDCAAKYLELTREQSVLQRAFEKWFMVHYPQYWKHTSLAELAERASGTLGHLDRSTFLREFMDYL